MITALRKFYRRSFSSPSKAQLLDLFEGDALLNRAVILTEVSPLTAIQTTYSWQESRDAAHVAIHESNLKTQTERTIAERSLSPAQFAEVIRQIEASGGIGLGDFRGKAKDGIHFSLAWGDRSRISLLRISNPQFGSRKHQQLIETLKSLALRGHT
jgi:hypothetical protein